MRISLLWILPFLALAACKGDEPAANGEWPSFEPQPKAAAASPLPKACELVTTADAQTLLAQEVGLMSDDPENCMWAGSEGVGSITMLMVQLIDNDDVATAQSTFEAIAGMQGDLAEMVNSHVGQETKKSGQALENLGDEAWLDAAAFGASFGSHQVGSQRLTVRKGTRLLTLNVTGSTRTEGLGQRMEALARAAVPRL
ncbi:MAG: hypothetical protein ACT4PZ_07990 [Panacagrimonas sp.]